MEGRTDVEVEHYLNISSIRYLDGNCRLITFGINLGFCNFFHPPLERLKSSHLLSETLFLENDDPVG